MTQNISNQPSNWQNFTVQFPVPSSRLSRDDLKLLYQILDEKQKEYRDKTMGLLSRMENESERVFEQRKKSVFEAFVTSVTIRSENGASFSGNTDAVFDKSAFPKKVRSIFYSTQSVPEVVLKHTPLDRVQVFLDFSQPPLLDLTRMPTLPTHNESSFEINAKTETWCVAARAKLQEFFEERRIRNNWLHLAGVYDVFLYFLAFPFAVLVSVRVGQHLTWLAKLDEFPKALVYLYICFGSIIAYRLCFSYARWAFPKFELEGRLNAQLCIEPQ